MLFAQKMHLLHQKLHTQHRTYTVVHVSIKIASSQRKYFLDQMFVYEDNILFLNRSALGSTPPESFRGTNRILLVKAVLTHESRARTVREVWRKEVPFQLNSFAIAHTQADTHTRKI